MSVEDEKKKPRKAPAKKATTAKKTTAALSTELEGEKKVKPASSPARKKAATKVLQEEPVQQVTEPTHAEIAELAHTYFAERGYQHGFHEHDWYRAESDLRRKLS